jgi:hypothetical protein
MTDARASQRTAAEIANQEYQQNQNQQENKASDASVYNPIVATNGPTKSRK